MSVNNPPVVAVVALAMVVVIFPVFREVVCWYWKIDRMVELLACIDATLLLLRYKSRPDCGVLSKNGLFSRVFRLVGDRIRLCFVSRNSP
jgi:hypothetical protein